jgi:hypothetical protein
LEALRRPVPVFKSSLRVSTTGLARVLWDPITHERSRAAVSLWLNSGVPATEVSRRAGHGVAVLLKIYAHCIDGQAHAANKRITDALGAQDTQPESEPGDEEDDDSAQAS